MNNQLTPETDALILSKAGFGLTDCEWRTHSRRLERERDEAREENKFLRVFLAHIRDNAYIRYGKRRVLLEFSDIKEEVSRKCKLFRQCQEAAK